MEPRRRSYAPDRCDGMNPFSAEGQNLLSLLDHPSAPRHSIDTRLREALKPLVNEADILRQDQFEQLAHDTHAVLRTRLEANEDSDEIRTAISELLTLLEENLALQATLETYLNRVKKV
jgi:hypothetical protein